MVAVNKRPPIHELIIFEVMSYLIVAIIIGSFVVAAIGASYFVWEITPFNSVVISP